MENEVDAGGEGGQESCGALVGSLGVRDLRGGQVAARPEWNPEPRSELADRVEHEGRLRRSESGGAALHRHRGGEGAEDDGRPGTDYLGEGDSGERFRESLGHRRGHRHRATWRRR